MIKVTLDANRAESINHFPLRTGPRNLMTDLLLRAFRLLPASLTSAAQTVAVKRLLVSWLPAPQSPDGRRPVCIQSLFILCTSLIAVMETSWFFSPNSSSWAKRGIYRHGSDRRDGRFSLTRVSYIFRHYLKFCSVYYVFRLYV